MSSHIYSPSSYNSSELSIPSSLTQTSYGLTTWFISHKIWSTEDLNNLRQRWRGLFWCVVLLLSARLITSQYSSARCHSKSSGSLAVALFLSSLKKQRCSVLLAVSSGQLPISSHMKTSEAWTLLSSWIRLEQNEWFYSCSQFWSLSDVDVNRKNSAQVAFFDDNKCSCSYLNIHLISLTLSYDSGNLNPRILAMQVCVI